MSDDVNVDVADDVVETNSVEGADTQNDVPTTTENDTQTDEASQDDGTPDDTPDDKPKPRNRAEERIRQLVQERNEWRAKAEAVAKQESTPSQEPTLDQFDDYAEYQKALNRYQIEQAKAELKQEWEQSQNKANEAKYEADVHLALSELEAEGIDMSAYFEKSKTMPSLPITLDKFGLSAKETFLLAKDLLDDENLYWELSQLSAPQFAAKIGVMIDKRQNKPVPTPPKQSKAPPPIKPVSGSTPAQTDVYSLSDDEFLKSRGLA